MTKAEEIVMRAFEAVNTRNDALFASVIHPEAAFIWPESLRPGQFKTLHGRQASNYDELWEPFQPRTLFPTRRMDARIVASNGDRVVVRWHQRGINANAESLDVEVVGLYDVRDGLLYHAQMFYFDGYAARRFLESKPYTEGAL